MSIATLPQAKTAGVDLLSEAEELLNADCLVPAIATLHVAIEHSALLTGEAAGLWPDHRRPIQVGRICSVLRKNGVIKEWLQNRTVELGNKIALYSHNPNLGPVGTAMLVSESRIVCGCYERLQARLIAN